MSLDFVLLFTISVLALSLGLFVLLNNYNEKVNRLFFILILFIIAWFLSNFLENEEIIFHNALFLRSDFAIAVLSTYFFLLFSFIFPRQIIKLTPLKKSILFIIPALFSIASLFTDLVVKNVTFQETISFERGYLFLPYLVVTIGYFGYSILHLFKKYKVSIDYIEKKQLSFAILGWAVSLLLAVTINLFLQPFDFLVDSPLFIYRLGIFSFIFLIIFTAIAILKYHLFSIKIIAAELSTFSIWGILFFDLLNKTTTGGYIESVVVLTLAVIVGISLIKSVKKEVEQRERIEKLVEDLSAANEKLKGLDKLKSEFLSLASHQLRSPLTAIKGYTSMLVEGSYGILEEKQKEVIGHVLASTQSMISMVEDFLNVSKIEQGGMQYVFAPISLAKLISGLFAELKITAQNKGLDFALEMDIGDTFTTSADAGKLRQVFLNLIDNSIKYTPSGFVHLFLARSANNETITFSVKDSGVGIAPGTKEKLFQKFNRGEGGKLNTGGSGLGLYLAREIVKAHHGRVSVESDGKGKGSCFSVELPAVIKDAGN